MLISIKINKSRCCIFTAVIIFFITIIGVAVLVINDIISSGPSVNTDIKTISIYKCEYDSNLFSLDYIIIFKNGYKLYKIEYSHNNYIMYRYSNDTKTQILKLEDHNSIFSTNYQSIISNNTIEKILNLK
ncbi:hypothetical protein BCR32DRAFT_281751 [Anaeromyces robustus]|uniref:Uncharacterized protein n=1 Tax=Anaeromyces robustus TaxID=1754192 RepID=A0A1Y1WZP6_9FUNG|nr:hypothetical protein BCR32DRAFT_281751 [Anaeromyces robustus]|eukprot:ORX79049.1 hypothetical protein BCR32DRAFT_281751 [Anaeromyces robustus]